jgi:hypothetical protein
MNRTKIAINQVFFSLISNKRHNKSITTFVVILSFIPYNSSYIFPGQNTVCSTWGLTI